MRLSIIFFALLALGLSACDETQLQQQATSIEKDWIDGDDTPSPTTSPAPSPTASPAPTPSSGLYNGPASVEKYVQKFVADALIQGIDVLPEMDKPKLEIQFASLDSYGSSVIGLCETGTNRRRVTFDPDFWDRVSETQRELLAHHELGHCVLYRAHRSDVLDTGKYASIMYPIIMASSTYTSNYDYYQEELFTWGAMEPGQNPDQITTHVCDY